MIQMPINKKEHLVYTFFMVTCMASIMTTYNIVIHDGLSINSLKKAWLIFPISFVAAFLVEWFIVGRIAHYLIGKYVKNNDPLPKKILLSALFFVTGMVIFMSIICAILFNNFDKNWISNTLISIPRNFIMAYPLQVLFAGPLVGIFFRKLFPVGTIVEIK